jgi:hypothetical protein
MIDMQEDEIRHLIGRLDRLVTKEQAIVRAVQDDPDFATVIHANQLGYLRLGIEFQKAALAPMEGHEVEVDLAYLLGQDAICWEFRRREGELPLSEPERMAAAKGGFVASMIGIAIVGFLFASCVTGAPIVANTIIGAMSGSP